MTERTPAPQTWTIRSVLGWTAQHFAKLDVDAPRLTAEVLLAHVLEVDRVRLYVDLDRPLTRAELTQYRALISRRSSGEPTQYLTGKREFYARPFKVDRRALVPRPETELLVEGVLRHFTKDAAPFLLDLCTGTGCVALTLAAERPNAKVWAVDLSPDACALARENAESLGLVDRVQIAQGDLFSPVPRELAFDAISANPPYIAAHELTGLPKEVQQEPRLALDGGPDGLDVIRRIAQGASTHLKPGGLLAMEIAESQGPAVQALLLEAGYADVRIEKDLARHDRLAFAVRGAAGEPRP